MESNNLIDNKTKPSRPNGLMILLVLTFINAGGSFVMGIFTILFLKPSAGDIRANKIQMDKSISLFQDMDMNYLATLLQKIQVMTEVLNENFIASNLLNIGVSLLGVIAAFLMLKRFQSGFHVYIIYNLFQIGSLYFFLSPALVPTVVVVTNLVISLVFILLYSRYLNYLKGK